MRHKKTIAGLVFYEPYLTLKWAAFHLYGEYFSGMFARNELTMHAYVILIESSITHVEDMLKSRDWFELRLKRSDRRRLKALKELRKIITNE